MAVKKASAGRAKRATKKVAGSRDRPKRAAASGSRRTGATRTALTAADERGTAPRTSSKSAAKRSTGKTVAPKKVRGSPRSSAKSASPTAPAPAVRKALSPYRKKRDFTKTAEPSGEKAARKTKALRFVIQKHAASHLHFDWRLELDGVMKSWAVPKGPSVVPGERRLAMEVEDHPISYNTFEGTIPKGQYGGGTVMLWDRGVYESTDGGGAESLRAGYAKGKLDITLLGERLKGSFTMVRTRGKGERAQWLLIKRTDDWADADRDIVSEITTSVDSGRSMEQIAAGKRIWNSNRK